jgi:hypothetical protein
MSEHDRSKRDTPTNAGELVTKCVRKLQGSRRLLVATTGAATIQFMGGCKAGGRGPVSNLMLPSTGWRLGRAYA